MVRGHGPCDFPSRFPVSVDIHRLPRRSFPSTEAHMRATIHAVLGALAVMSLLFVPTSPARAAWGTNGNAVANQQSLSERISSTYGNQNLLATDGRGGLVLSYLRDLATDSVRV